MSVINIYKRLSLALFAFLIFISTLLGSHIDAMAGADLYGGMPVGTGSSGDGNGCGGATVIGLAEIDNVVLTNPEYKLARYPEGENPVTPDWWKNMTEKSIEGGDKTYLGDCYVSMLDRNSRGWDVNFSDPSWLSTAALIPRFGFKNENVATQAIFQLFYDNAGGGLTRTMTGAGSCGWYSGNITHGPGNQNYGSELFPPHPWGTLLDLSSAPGCYETMMYFMNTGNETAMESYGVSWGNEPGCPLIEKSEDGKKGYAIIPAGWANGMAPMIPEYKISYADTDENTAKLWAMLVLESGNNQFGYQNALGGNPAAVPPREGVDGPTCHLNQMAATVDNLARAIACQLADNPGLLFQELNNFYNNWVPNLGNKEIEWRMQAYNLLMIAAIGRLQFMCDPSSADVVAELIKKSWMNRNANGSEKFIVVQGFMVAGQKRTATAYPELYSFPACVQDGVGTGYTIDMYNQIMHEIIWDPATQAQSMYRTQAEITDNMSAEAEAKLTEWWHTNKVRSLLGVNLGGNREQWMFNYFATYSGIKPWGLLIYGGASKDFWKSPYGWESTLYLRDVKNNRMSTLGTFMYSAPLSGGDTIDEGDPCHGDKTDGDCLPVPTTPPSGGSITDSTPVGSTPSGGDPCYGPGNIPCDPETRERLREECRRKGGVFFEECCGCDTTTETTTRQTTTDVITTEVTVTDDPDCAHPPCQSLPPPNDPPPCIGDGCEPTSQNTPSMSINFPPPDDTPPTDEEPPQPSISVSVDPDTQKVEEACSSINLVDIDIKMSASTEVINKIYNYYTTKVLAEDPTADMRIRLELSHAALAEDPKDQDYYNVFAKGVSDFLMTKTDEKVELVSQPFTDLATLTQFLNGAKSELSFIDNNITVCDKVSTRYYAMMHVCFSGKGIDIHADPKGEEKIGSLAFDTATLYAKEDPHYYSDMRHVPVAEIKADAPYEERYEAMAGVPTTEDLYFGSGATEFMVNVDLKWRTEKAQRIYKIKVTNSNCYSHNIACVFSCGGHEDGSTCTADACGGGGCAGKHFINDKHPATCTYEVIITQPIDQYSYMDIIAQDLYRLNYIKLDGTKTLHTNSSFSLDPELGYYSFYDQEGYSNGNGRLHFNVEIDSQSASKGKRLSTEVNKAKLWGDSTAIITDEIKGEHANCKTNAVTAINKVIDALADTYVTVVSDYTVLETSEGYQHISSHTYDSQHENLTSFKVADSDFGDSSDSEASNSFSKEIITEGLKFNEIPKQEEMWDDNGNCAAKWDPLDITTTGYNGEYDSPNDKYENSNRVDKKNAMQLYIDDEQPNIKKIEGNKDFHTGRGPNERYLKTGLDILDSTVVKSAKGTKLHGTMISLNGWQNWTDDYVDSRVWSNGDSIKPVTNGEKHTGNAYSKYSLDISYKLTKGGKSFGKWCRDVAVPYSPEHKRINNIVVHNPISNRDAVLLSNDSKYDDRYWGSLVQMPAPVVEVKCPRNASCQFSTLTCTLSQVHSSSCYTQVVDGYSCGNPINTHKHKSDCYIPTYEWVWKGCSNHGGSYWSESPDSLVGVINKCTNGYWEKGTGTGKKIVSGQRIFKYHKEGCSLNGILITIQHKGDPTVGDLVAAHGSGHPTCFESATFTFVEEKLGCFGQWNAHAHTGTCQDAYRNVLICTDPHHHEPGEAASVTNPKNHYPFADARCYTPCNSDEKHSPPKTIKLPDNSAQDMTGNAFINVDRDFQIYYPDKGDFAQQPNLLGISECTKSRGKGYVDDTDTAVWVRNKFMMIPTNVIDSSGNYWYNLEPIDLNKLPIVYKDSDRKEWNDDSSYRRGLGIYTFTCVSMNAEAASATLTFLSVATNAPEVYTYNDSDNYINLNRYTNKAANMSVKKQQRFDIVGSIGSLTIHDVGDPRFAELFKKPINNGNWLIPNVVREVDYNKSNMIVSDEKDVRLEPVEGTVEGGVVKSSTITKNDGVDVFHGTYGITDQATGGKSHSYAQFPLTSLKNPIVALQKEQMRPGYNIYMDVETLGRYIGENTYIQDGKVMHHQRDSKGTGSYEKFMQIQPTYYELNLETGKYKPVDAYMKTGTTFTPVYLTDKSKDVTEYYNYLKWLEESARRGFTRAESIATVNVQDGNSTNIYKMRAPVGDPDVIGTPKRLYLVDLDRTFIGSRIRYGVNYDRGNIEGGNKKNNWDDYYWNQNSQRWHFTLGLPSSVVFVYAGTAPTDNNKFQQEIEQIHKNNSVIVCTINIKVRGTVWTLEYDGKALNKMGFDIPYGDTPKHYDAPKETDDPHRSPDDPPPDPNEPVKDPVIVIMDNRRTAADDMQTQGTH